MSDAPELPKSIQDAVSWAGEYLKPHKIYLFGSQARGDSRESSDYDFAVDPTEETLKRWVYFMADLTDEAPTLRAMDWLRLDEVDDELKARILKEGVIVYERSVKS